ncbi:MAG: uroporphyrinogen decarboxylase family protein [Planctomycetia bacterium]|nr:uroporphyrinogen decarboxylase family protein [Planctomycetia bacterium]
MTPRDRVINTIYHQVSAPIPTVLNIPQKVYQIRKEECDELRCRFTCDLDFLDYRFSFSSSKTDSSLLQTDNWGCLWYKTPDGIFPDTDSHLLNDGNELESCLIPKPSISESSIQEVTKFCDGNPRFIILQSGIRPFRRLQALLGASQAITMIEQRSAVLRHFLNRLHTYYLQQLHAWCATPVDAICIGDDWTDSTGLPFSSEIWEELFLPMYSEYSKILQENDKFTYFSTEGNIQVLLPQLISAGVDVVRCNTTFINTERLTHHHSGKITFHLILDPHFTSGSTLESISEKIMSIRYAAGDNGGIIGECSFLPEAPLRNISGAMLNWRRRMPVEI